MNNKIRTTSAHRFRYVLHYTTWVWSTSLTKNTPVERVWSVPFLWLAVLIMSVRCQAWFMGGSVVDTLTGNTLYHINLEGNILGDGRAHLVAGPSLESGARKAGASD